MPERVKVTGGMYRGKVPTGAVYVGRAHPGLKQSPFANPWCIKPPGHVGNQGNVTWAVTHHRDLSRVVTGLADRQAALDTAVRLFREHLDSRPDLVERARVDLAGKDLACWCKPNETCHADVLLAIANQPDGGEAE